MIPYSFGPQRASPTTFRFRLWAPSLTQSGGSVELLLHGQPPLEMPPIGAGWFAIEAACGDGAQYQFRVRRTAQAEPIVVNDPASRLQAGDLHDPSVVVGDSSYAWKTDGWRGRPWHEAVIYELHVGLCGGFRGVMARLDEIARLGFTAIELMPLADFPGSRNWGYDGALPYAPDTSYGTPDDLRRLIDRAHELNLMVFLDVVYNHFGPDGNYLHAYAETFFRDDVHTPWGAAIDFRQEPVRAFFTENAIYWLSEFRFDGLRLDATNQILEQDWLPEFAGIVRRAIPRQVHLVLEHAGNIARWLGDPIDAQWNDDSHHILHVLLTSEIDGYYGDFADEPAQRLSRWLSEGFIYQGEKFAAMDGIHRGEPSGHLPPTAFVNCLQNHDQIGNRALGERLTRLATPDALRAAVALLLLCPQIPLIFMGEEEGASDPFLFFASHGPELAQAVREGRRKEFAGFRGFDTEEALAQIPDPNEESTYESSRFVPSDSNDARQWREYYRSLLNLRAELFNRIPGATSSGAEVLGPKAVIARWVLGNGQTLSLATNLGDSAVSLPVPPSAASVWHATSPDAAAAIREGRLAGFSTVALLQAQ